MKWYLNLKIRTKLLFGFLIVACIAGVEGYIGIRKIQSSNQAYSNLFKNYGNAQGYIGNVYSSFLLEQILLRSNVGVTDATVLKGNFERSEMMANKVMKGLEDYKKTVETDEDKALFIPLESNILNYQKIFQQSIEKAKSNNWSEALKLIDDAIPLAIQINGELDKVTEYNIIMGNRLDKQLSEETKKTVRMVTFIVIVAVAAAVFLGYIITLIISKPIRALTKAAKQISIGEVAIELNIDRKDEIGQLAESFIEICNSIKEQAKAIVKIADGDLTTELKIRSEEDIVNINIQKMIEINKSVFGEIRKSSDQVNSAAGQVAQGSTMLAQASTEQASTVEEITSTVGSIASQSKENANSARNANELANEARASAEVGSEQMKNMMNSMEEINDASRSISKIIRVIDDIAFQTNILALNAAVEAARAGSHGKGFAVVAEEVRNLAARSAKAANETTDLIESTIAKVNAGTKIASETASALNIINDKIGKVTGMIAEIATSSGEQATAVAQVSLGMGQIAEAVSTNSATAEESAAASEQLSAQASMLKESVSRFKLKDGGNNYEYLSTNETGHEEIEHYQVEYGNFGKY